MNNIFENAKFGDKFLTRDGRVAIYHRFETKLNLHVLFVENLDCCLYCENTGLHAGNHIVLPEWKEDIVSRYQESVDEEKLNELAENYCISEFAMTHEDSTESAIAYKAFKACYREVIENRQ